MQKDEPNTEYTGQLRKYSRFCFKDLYIGTTSVRLQRSGTHAYEWNRFIYQRFMSNQRHLQRYNAMMRPRIPKQKILFLNKTMGEHRRYYANDINVVCKYISDLFGVQVDILTDKQLVDMSLEEQINLVLANPV